MIKHEIDPTNCVSLFFVKKHWGNLPLFLGKMGPTMEVNEKEEDRSNTVLSAREDIPNSRIQKPKIVIVMKNAKSYLRQILHK